MTVRAAKDTVEKVIHNNLEHMRIKAIQLESSSSSDNDNEEEDKDVGIKLLPDFDSVEDQDLP